MRAVVCDGDGTSSEPFYDSLTFYVDVYDHYDKNHMWREIELQEMVRAKEMRSSLIFNIIVLFRCR